MLTAIILLYLSTTSPFSLTRLALHQLRPQDRVAFNKTSLSPCLCLATRIRTPLDTLYMNIEAIRRL